MFGFLLGMLSGLFCLLIDSTILEGLTIAEIAVMIIGIVLIFGGIGGIVDISYNCLRKYFKDWWR